MLKTDFKISSVDTKILNVPQETPAGRYCSEVFLAGGFFAAVFFRAARCGAAFFLVVLTAAFLTVFLAACLVVSSGATAVGSFAAAAGFSQLKINAVLIRRINGGTLPDFVLFAAQLGCEIRFIELMPYGQGAALFRSDYLAADEALDSLGRAFGHLAAAAPTGTAQRYRLVVDGRAATVGMITPVSRPFCVRCDRLRLGRNGRLHACLRRSDSVDLLGPLRAGDSWTVRQRITDALQSKQDPGTHWPERHMVTIGG